MASDPCLPLFKKLRNQIYLINKISFSNDGPSSDFYFSDEKLKIMELIQETDLKIEFPQEDLPELREDLKQRMKLGAPELAPYFGNLNGENFIEIFSNCIQTMSEIYKAQDGSWCGFNDNWVSEYFPLLAKAFPTAKFIGIVRDPRSCITSITKIKPKKPLFVPPIYSFIRSWRKHVDFTIYMQSIPLFKDRFYLLQYENVARDPEGEIKKVCDYLDIVFSKEMLDTLKFRPLRGDKWQTYSHFKEELPDQGIYADSIDRWKTFLPSEAIEFIEFACGPELRYLGFNLSCYNSGPLSTKAQAFAESDLNDAKGWKLPMRDIKTEFNDDLKRYNILKKDGLTTEDIKKNFLFYETYSVLKN